MHSAYDYDCSAAHGAQWQELELILHRLLQHGNMRKRRERLVYASLRPAEAFIRACMTPTEAACFRVRKCANSLINTLRIYTQTLIGRDAPDIRLDNPAFFISGIRPDTGYGNRISGRISGYRKGRRSG